MSPQQAMDILERAKSFADSAVYHEGNFGSAYSYDKAKNLRREYKAAVRSLKKHFKEFTHDQAAVIDEPRQCEECGGVMLQTYANPCRIGDGLNRDASTRKNEASNATIASGASETIPLGTPTAHCRHSDNTDQFRDPTKMVTERDGRVVEWDCKCMNCGVVVTAEFQRIFKICKYCGGEFKAIKETRLPTAGASDGTELLIARMRDQINELSREKFKHFNEEECWIYQGDGHDYPESLVCPVVMSVDKFRALLATAGTLKEAIEEIALIKQQREGALADAEEEIAALKAAAGADKADGGAK